MSKATKNPLDVFKPAKSAGQLIKSFRKNFDISQESMAKVCNLTQTNLSKIENGSREVGADVALRLSAVMGLSPDSILYPNGYESEPEYKATVERSVSIFLMAAKGR